MTNLLDEVIDAHGGLHRWKAVGALRATVSLGGPFWDLRAVSADMRTNVTVDVQMHEQLVSLNQWTDTEHRFVLRTNPEIATMTAGDFVEPVVRHNPRASFPAEPDARWDRIQTNYFMGYALWNYLTTPYLLGYPASGRSRWNRGAAARPCGVDCGLNSRQESPPTATAGVLLRLRGSAATPRLQRPSIGRRAGGTLRR